MGRKASAKACMAGVLTPPMDILRRPELAITITAMDTTLQHHHTLLQHTPPSYYPPTSYPPSHQGQGSRIGAALATAAAAYGVHRIAHGSHYGGHGYGAYAGHMPGGHYGKFKHGKFGKHKHGMFGGKFKKWK